MTIIQERDKAYLYSSLKTLLNKTYGIVHQNARIKTLSNPKGIMSICSKILIQLNAKLNGTVWLI